MNMVYHVISEFTFDIQGALISAGAVQNAVHGISNAANLALSTLGKIPSMLGSALGINFGVGGILFSAVKSSENLTKNSLALTSIISSNMEHLSGDVGSFNKQMITSQKILQDLAKTAQAFSLDETAFVDTVKTMSAMLVPKGLAGDNFGTAKEMARGLLKSAPVLGVDPGFVQGELLRAVEGQASMNDTLFRRMVAETKAFAPLRAGGTLVSGGGARGGVASAQFNKMDIGKRVQMMVEGLTQFGNIAEVNTGMANLLSNRMMALKNQLFGLNGVVRPLGDVIAPRIVQAFDFLSRIIETVVRPAIIKISEGLEEAFKDPERVLAFVMQIRGLRRDMELTANAVKMMGQIAFAKFVYDLAVKIPYVSAAIGTVVSFVGKLLLGAAAIASFTAFLATLAVTVGVVMKFFVILRFAFFLFQFVLGSIIAPVMVVIGLFQLFRRALAYAKIEEAKALVTLLPTFTEKVAELTRAFYVFLRPIGDMIDTVARMIAPYLSIAPVMEGSIGIMDMLIGALETMSKWLIIVLSGLQGFIFAFMTLPTALEIAWNSFANTLFTNFVNIFTAAKLTFNYLEEVVYTVISNIANIVTEGFSLIGTTISKIIDNILAGNLAGAGAAAFTGGFGINSMLAPLPTMPALPGLAMQSEDIGAWDKITTAMNAGMDDVIARYANSLGGKDGDKNVVMRNQHINKIEIKQDFKESIEPDRVAHALVKTLHEINQNPLQASGRSFAGAFFGAQ